MMTSSDAWVIVNALNEKNQSPENGTRVAVPDQPNPVNPCRAIRLKLNILKMGPERMQINFDETGIVVDAPADSPFINASFNTMGTIHAVNGVFTYSGAALWTRPNGEQIYA